MISLCLTNHHTKKTHLLLNYAQNKINYINSNYNTVAVLKIGYFHVISLSPLLYMLYVLSLHNVLTPKQHPT